MMAALFVTWWFLDGSRRRRRIHEDELEEIGGTWLDLMGLLWPWIAVLAFLLLP